MTNGNQGFFFFFFRRKRTDTGNEVDIRSLRLTFVASMATMQLRVNLVWNCLRLLNRFTDLGRSSQEGCEVMDCTSDDILSIK